MNLSTVRELVDAIDVAILKAASIAHSATDLDDDATINLIVGTLDGIGPNLEDALALYAAIKSLRRQEN